MQNYFTSLPFLVILITSAVSLIAFQNQNLLYRLLFHESSVLVKKEWYRLVSHALVHGSLMHLLFNMMTLYFFAPAIEGAFGAPTFLTIYIVSIFAGGILSLLIHRKEPNYTALGASGGVVGILFSSIAMTPFSKIYIIPFPFGIDAWIFGVFYLSFTVYAMKYMPQSQIGHDAHLGGAIAGVLSILLIAPEIVLHNGLYLFLMLIPIVVGLVLISKGVIKND